MNRALDHADLFLVVSGLVAVFSASLVAVALGLESRVVALGTAAVVAAVHGLLGVAVRRLKRAAYSPPTLHPLETPTTA